MILRFIPPAAGRRQVSSRATQVLAAAAMALMGLVLTVEAGAARPFVDAAGRKVEVPERARRILAAGPPASVLLYTLAPETMIGWVRAPSPRRGRLPVTEDTRPARLWPAHRPGQHRQCGGRARPEA